MKDKTYKITIIILVVVVLILGIKAVKLQKAYTKAETTKVKFCKENITFKQKIDTLETENLQLSIDNTRLEEKDWMDFQQYLDYIELMEQISE
jgi:hypothetical protein